MPESRRRCVFAFNRTDGEVRRVEKKKKEKEEKEEKNETR